MERHRDLKPSDPNGNGHGPQLVSGDEVEEAVASMLRIWGVYVTAGVLGHYREVLDGLPPRAVLEAVKRWLRQPPADRAALPHELRAMAEAAVGRAPAPAADVAALERQRASPDDISAAYAEALAARPDQEFLRWAVAQRQRRLAAGAAGTGAAEAEALVQGLAGRRTLPEARAAEAGA